MEIGCTHKTPNKSITGDDL